MADGMRPAALHYPGCTSEACRGCFVDTPVNNTPRETRMEAARRAFEIPMERWVEMTRNQKRHLVRQMERRDVR